MEGYGTFASDARAGTPSDGIIVSMGVVDWDPERMDPGLNGYMTLVHESGHWLELPHNFDSRGQVSDMPADDQVDPGNVYEYNDWPRTDGEPHDICNVMGYEVS
jgi:hypothetical protein